MTTKGYIFDYGGTLDTRGNHWGRVIWHAYEQAEIPISWEQYREAYVYAERTLGRNPIVTPTWTFKKLLDVKLRLQMEYLFTKGYWTADKKLFTQKQLQILNLLYEQVCQTTAESLRVLQQISESKVLVSNFYGNISVVLQEFHLDHLFQEVIESAVVGIRKPDARIFSLGVEALGLKPEEVVVVGDSISKDIVPAHSIGCQTVWFKGESWDDKPEDETVPDRIITELTSLQHGALPVKNT